MGQRGNTVHESITWGAYSQFLFFKGDPLPPGVRVLAPLDIGEAFTTQVEVIEFIPLQRESNWVNMQAT
jgi:hypothetical protein